jgi:hypothetical protein
VSANFSNINQDVPKRNSICNHRRIAWSGSRYSE